MDIGEKIKNLRIQKNLTQEELANRCELSKGFISQVENNITSPSIATLIDILETLGTSLQLFFNEKDEEQITFSSNDMFEKENHDSNYIIKWLIPNAQKNIMEPIILKLNPGGIYDIHDAHEGEEFGYVLKGKISLYYGNEKYILKKGESFYYKPSKTHYIKNDSKSSSEVLWVSTPPSF
ncbi:helix-turn-helix domain-containing protein [Clostridium sp. HCP1S3_B4]|uniref:helix-turn-helix domain-containing protein n=1 Tax=unclassified Clostridium TaxID=2614128 RepID=UPI0016932E69|nr:XRE family transcriptional regulator [Clostridiales bacterium]MDY2729352.1 XRE family transcriptional regulator [Clostridium sp.]NLK24456.1 cupin domain-containing protein [Clostridiales bacterium]